MDSKGKQAAADVDREPPTYDDSTTGTSTSRASDGAERSSDWQSPPRDHRATYALTLQRACTQALQRVRSNNIIANSNWSAPLATAPSAIATMAILFKVADQDCAAGLEVESLDVMDSDGTTLRGKLP
jgi:hypothetical protein